MNVVKIEYADDCVEGSNVKDIYIEKEINYNFIQYLGKLGKLFFFDGIEKPYFKVIVRNKYTIKSTEGNNILRVLLPDIDAPDYIPDLMKYIKKY
jgi:hypothetical protein